MKALHRWILPPVAAASLMLVAAGSALADAKATVSVFNDDGTPAGTTVCAFYVELNPVDGGETGTWQLRDAGGTVVEDGSYGVTGSDGDRVPDDGSWLLANGTYTFVWDDEEVDNSHRELDIVVECEAATATPGTPATAAPTPTFAESVEAATDVPSLTQPPTSTMDPTSRPDPAAWIGSLLAILGLTAVVLIATPRVRSSRR